MLWAVANLLIRSGLILAAAEICRRLARRASASYRHRILVTAFLLLLAWPFCSALIPELRVPLWTWQQVGARVTVEQRIVSVGGRSLSESRFVNWPLTIWLAGVFFSLLPAVVGHIRVRSIVAKSVPLAPELWPEQVSVGREPRVLIHSRVAVPFVFGVFRPHIVLPSDWMQWPLLRRRAVLLHELAHVERRDVCWQLLANVAIALWWFQPLCWLSRNSLRRESELSCDAAVLDSGIRATDYARELLAVAHGLNKRPACSAAAIGMAQGGDLQKRLYAILDPRQRSPRKLPFAAMAVLSATALTVSAITIVPEKTKLSEGYSMKRTLLSGLLVSAGLSAATIGGSVLDPNGTAIANAQASLYNPTTSMRQSTTTAPDGKFAFDSLGAGSYILRIEKPGFAPLYRAFNVKDDSDVQRVLVLPSQAADASGQPPKVIHVRSEVAENNLVTKVQPVYPASAKQGHVQGTVDLQVTISPEGIPTDIQVVSSPSDDLTQSALQAVEQWRYRPTLLNGQPVTIVTDVVVNYTLSE